MKYADPRAWLKQAEDRAERAARFVERRGVMIQTGGDVPLMHWSLKDDHPAMAAALAAVLDLHRPVGDARFVIQDCSQCEEAYPCTTVRAITDHLEASE